MTTLHLTLQVARLKLDIWRYRARRVTLRPCGGCSTGWSPNSGRPRNGKAKGIGHAPTDSGNAAAGALLAGQARLTTTIATTEPRPDPAGLFAAWN